MTQSVCSSIKNNINQPIDCHVWKTSQSSHDYNSNLLMNKVYRWSQFQGGSRDQESWFLFLANQLSFFSTHSHLYILSSNRKWEKRDSFSREWGEKKKENKESRDRAEISQWSFAWISSRNSYINRVWIVGSIRCRRRRRAWHWSIVAGWRGRGSLEKGRRLSSVNEMPLESESVKLIAIRVVV